MPEHAAIGGSRILPGRSFVRTAGGIYVRSVVVIDPNTVTRTMLFKIGLPLGYTPAIATRTTLCGHGSGEYSGTGASDNNNTTQMQHGYAKWWSANSATATDILVAPQLPLLGDGSGPWQHFMGQVYLQALVLTLMEFAVHRRKVAWAGYSEGASRGWQMAIQYPGYFAAQLLMSGRNYGPSTLESTGATDAAANTAVWASVRTPTWIWHGTADATVSDSYDIATVAGYTAEGIGNPPIAFNNTAGAGHTDTYWDSVCSDAGVQAWLPVQTL